MWMTREEQLDQVARNYGEWPDGASCVVVVPEDLELVYGYSLADARRECSFTKSEVEQRKAELQNKPSWDDAPINAVSLIQSEAGDWEWLLKVENLSATLPCYELDPIYSGYSGEVVGDWRCTFEERPEPEVSPEEEEAFNMLEARNGECIGSSSAECDGEVMSQSNSNLYPQYFKDVSCIDEIDVYGVHQLFEIDDPSGAIQHASKKLLLSGVRTGGKSKYKDIKEARDTLNRWLELNDERP